MQALAQRIDEEDDRQLAYRAARSAGLSLADWLDGIVASHAAKVGVNVEDIAPEERLEIIAAKLGRLGRQESPRNSDWSELQNRSETLRASVTRRQWRDHDSGPSDDFRARDAAKDDVVPTEVPAGRRSHRDRERNAEAELDAALVAPDERSDRVSPPNERAAGPGGWRMGGDAGRGSDQGSLDLITDRLARIEQYVSKSSHERGYMASRETLTQLEGRIQDIAHENRTKAQLPATRLSVLHDLGDRLTDLTDRIERLDRAGSPRERSEHFSRLEAKLGGILAALDRQLAQSTAASTVSGPDNKSDARSPGPAENVAGGRRAGLNRREGSLGSVATAITEIAKRQRDLDDGATTHEPPGTSADRGYERSAHSTLGTGRVADGLVPAQADVSSADVTTDAAGDARAFDRRLEEIAQRIERATERTRGQDEPDKGLDAIRTEIGRMAKAIEDLSSGGNRANEAALGRLEGGIAKVAERLETLDRSGRDPEAELLRREIREMSGVITDLASTNARQEHSAVAALQGEIARLASRFETQARPEPHPELQGLRQDVSDMSAVIADVLPRGSIAALERAVLDLTERVESSRSEGVRENLLAPVEQLARDIRTTFETANPRASVDALDTEIRKIGAKLEQLGRQEYDPDVFNRLYDHTREIRDLLTAAAQRPMPIEQLERQVAALGDRMEAVAAQSSRPSAGGDLAARSDDIRAMLRDLVPVDTIAALEHRVDALSRKIDDLLAAPQSIQGMDALNQRIDRIQQTLSQQLIGVGDTRPLENLVRRLADNVERFRGPEVDGGAIEAIESQIGKILLRLEKSEASFATLGAIERSVGDLFERLEESRKVAADAAVETARGTVRETVREVLESGTVQSQSLQPHVDHIGREVGDLRAMHDESDQRIRATLGAVHETLEKVVERLASLESEPSSAREPRPAMTHPETNESKDAAPRPRAETPRDQRLQPSGAAPAAAPAPISPSLPAAPQAAAPRAATPRGETDIDGPGFLIEPGSGPPSSRVPAQGRDVAPPGHANAAADPSPSGFIAAARRAAQAAAAESSALTARMTRARIASATDDVAQGEPRRTRTEQVIAFVAAKKRPILLGLAGLVILLGAYEIMRSLTASRQPAAAPVTSSAPSQPKRAEPQALLLPPVEADPAKAPAQPAASAGAGPRSVDVTPTGSVSPPGAFSHFDLGGPHAAVPILPAALQGNPAAQYELGVRLADGREMPRDLKSASNWFEKAAAQGLAPAQYRLGALYEKGQGVPKDLTLAIAWYQRAAEAGNARAMHNLAVITAEGGSGGQPNYVTAVSWFTKAAEMGVRDSQYNLAILTARGLGTVQDLPEAYVWFSLAAQQGDSDAAKKRDEVAKQLDAGTLAAAKARIQLFKTTPPNRAANVVPPPPGGWDPPLGRHELHSAPARAKVSAL